MQKSISYKIYSQPPQISSVQYMLRAPVLPWNKRSTVTADIWPKEHLVPIKVRFLLEMGRCPSRAPGRYGWQRTLGQPGCPRRPKPLQD